MPVALKLLDHAGHAPNVSWNDDWKEPSRRGWHDLSRWMATAWFEVHDQFHDGRLTSYLLRAFGYPNLFAYDPVKHGNAWLLDVGDGWGLTVQPFPFEASGFKDADPEERRWMLSGFQAHRMLDLIPLRTPDRRASPALMREIAQEFRRPVRFRDVLINASSVSHAFEIEGAPERDDIGATANVVIDPRIRISPDHPQDVIVAHPSRQAVDQPPSLSTNPA